MGKMSQPTTRYAAAFADAVSIIQGAIAQNDFNHIVAATSSVTDDSTFKLGSNRAKNLPDVLNIVEAVDYALNVNAGASDVHFITTGKHVLLHLTGNARILLVAGQRIHAINDTNSKVFLVVSTLAADGSVHTSQPYRLEPARRYPIT